MTGRIDGSQGPRNQTRRLGTTPLGEVPLPQIPRKMAGDSNQIRGRGTQPLQPSSTLPLRKEETPARKAEPEDATPWWKKIINKAEGAFDSARDVARSGKEVIRAGVNEVYESVAQGEGVRKALSDGKSAAGRRLVQEADPLLDKTLGEEGVFQDKGAKGLNALNADVASRLGVGESVTIQLDAGCTIPLEEFGIPNADLDGSGSVTLRRVQKTDAEGKPLTDENGKPVTELEATLELVGSAGASYSASVGYNATAKVGSHSVGARAEAVAEAGGGIQGRVAFTFNFDPSYTQQMESLNNLLTGTPRPSDLKGHLSSLEGEGGLYAEATAYASTGVGIFGQAAENGRYNPDEIETERGILNRLNTDIAGLETSVGLGAAVGQSHNYRTGEHTVYLNANGALHGSANAGALGAEREGNADFTLAITTDRSGKVTGASLERELTVEEFRGIRSAVENVSGRTIDEGILAQLGESDSVKVTYALDAEQLGKITSKGTGAAGEALRILRDNRNLKVSAEATHTDTAEIGINLDAAFGAEIGIRGGLKASHGQQTAILQE